ncbi:hypothetical protein PAECIP111890_03152 [Paenibacillus sp. JJ-223]|nr:hypothetical protein PAECIP111890_03152 [Paenibacillus sp. JJ-223]
MDEYANSLKRRLTSLYNLLHLNAVYDLATDVFLACICPRVESLI